MKDMTHQFLDWLRSKPADETYDYSDHCNCAFGQFLKAAGYCERPWVAGSWWFDSESGDRRRIPARLVYPLLSAETFGDLLDQFAQP